MSVKIGNILNGKKTYVVGAPRSKNTGQVFLMQLTTSGIVVRQNLTGEQFGSSFGYDIAIADINNDKSVHYLYKCSK
jgi:integrin alpha 7